MPYVGRVVDEKTARALNKSYILPLYPIDWQTSPKWTAELMEAIEEELFSEHENSDSQNDNDRGSMNYSSRVMPSRAPEDAGGVGRAGAVKGGS
eukprot:4976735-Pyramimonas_sp.AAC.1